MVHRPWSMGFATMDDGPWTMDKKPKRSKVFKTAAPLLLLIAGALTPARTEEPRAEPTEAEPPKRLYTGRVVLLEEVLNERKIPSHEETGKHVVLETPDGTLIPILADWRGRAFYQDERLRNRKVELIGYHRKGLPYLSVLAVYTFDEAGKRMYTDYWCDICSIPMYQIQLCECCQGDVRLRFQEQELPDYIREGDDKPKSK